MTADEVVIAPDGSPVVLGPVGQRIVFENDHVRVWEISLDPGEQQLWHRHDNPYLVVALAAADNRIDPIDGSSPRLVHEPLGGCVYREAGETHMLSNRGSTRYHSRLIEMKAPRETTRAHDAGTGTPRRTTVPPGISEDEWASNLSDPAAYSGAAPDLSREQIVTGDGGEALGRFREILVHTADLDWVDKSLAGLSHRMLWHNDDTGASIALVRFRKGAGIPSRHSHASNQFMFCLKGRYTYLPSGLTLTEGDFYWNPKGSMHGPTLAQQESILLEVYDGPHYPTQPEWYTDPQDAR